jgi:hypothetical protein
MLAKTLHTREEHYKDDRRGRDPLQPPRYDAVCTSYDRGEESSRQRDPAALAQLKHILLVEHVGPKSKVAVCSKDGHTLAGDAEDGRWKKL